MSENVILIVAGAAIFLVGLVKLRSGQTGGFSLKNFGISIGGRTTQSNRVGNVAPEADSSKKPNWVGLVIAVLGFLTALVGLLKKG
jgi:hypothetical protein